MTERETDHTRWFERLSDHLDGLLSPEDEAVLAQHVASCPRCAEVLAGLRDVAAEASRWNQPSEPSRNLWPGIASRLEPRAWWQRPWPRLALPVHGGLRWAAAGVLAVLLLVGGWATVARWQAAKSTVASNLPRLGETGPDAAFAQDVARLQREAAERLARDPHLVNVLDENLATLDVAIANYRDALQQAPDDHRMRDRLRQARERKLRILRDTIALATESGN